MSYYYISMEIVDSVTFNLSLEQFKKKMKKKIKRRKIINNTTVWTIEQRGCVSFSNKILHSGCLIFFLRF